MLLGSGLPCFAQIPVSWFGAVGEGGDDTDVVQAALNATAAQGETLEITPGFYNVRPLFLPSNTVVVIDPGVILEATSGFDLGDCLINVIDVANVIVSGSPGSSILQMRKSEYNSGEYRHCLNIQGATSVQVSGVACNDSGGDGVYIGEGSQGFSSDIQISDSTFDNNLRQGASVISAEHVLLLNCTFSNSAGANPGGGIDFEPNQAGDRLNDIAVIGGAAVGNAGSGVKFSLQNLTGDSQPVSIFLSGFVSEGNGGSGFFGLNEVDGTLPAAGQIVVADSFSLSDAEYGAVASYWQSDGTSLTFLNLTVINPNQASTNVDNAATAVIRGGGGTGPIGNVHFFGASISDATGHIDVYFTAYDWSGVGITELQFLNSQQLTGARLDTVLLDGVPTLPIDVP